MNEELKELTQLCNEEIIKIKEKYKVLKEKVRNKYKSLFQSFYEFDLKLILSMKKKQMLVNT